MVHTFISTPLHPLHDRIPMQDLRLADRPQMQQRGIRIGSVGLKLVQETLS